MSEHEFKCVRYFELTIPVDQHFTDCLCKRTGRESSISSTRRRENVQKITFSPEMLKRRDKTDCGSKCMKMRARPQPIKTTR